MKTLSMVSTYISFIIAVQATILGVVLIFSITKVDKLKEFYNKYKSFSRYCFLIVFLIGFAALGEFVGWRFYDYLFQEYRYIFDRIISYIILSGMMIPIILCFLLGVNFVSKKKMDEFIDDLTQSNLFLLGMMLLGGSIIPLFGLVFFSIKYQGTF